jgi:hypothetical protein
VTVQLKHSITRTQKESWTVYCKGLLRGIMRFSETVFRMREHPYDPEYTQQALSALMALQENLQGMHNGAVLTDAALKKAEAP